MALLRSVALLLMFLVGTIQADSPWVDLWKSDGPGGGTIKNITSMWGPSLVATANNTIIALGECDRSPTSHNGWIGLTRSLDGGRSWETPTTLYGCGSPAGLYARSTDTIFVFFGECGAPTPPGVNGFGLSAMSCAGGSVHWQYNTTTKHLRNTHINGPLSPLGVMVCEGSVKPTTGDAVGVGMPPNQAEPCPAEDLTWTLNRATGYLQHDNTGLCLTIPPRKSAVLMPCGASSGKGQKFVWNNDTLALEKGMFRAGECLGYLNTSVDEEPAAAEPSFGGVEFNLCTKTQDLYCNASRFRNVIAGYPECKSCLAANEEVIKQVGKCTAEKMSTYCGGPIGPAPTRGPHDEPDPPKGTGTVVMKSRDQGLTWSPPELINVTNTWGPHYAGNDVAHGVEMVAAGPHNGRLVIARRYDSTAALATDFARSYVLYSDDQGLSWTAGDLLPLDWTECQVAELKNGSLVLTSRLTGLSGFYCNGTQPRCFQRGFARSDDGGMTWAAVWYLEDYEPEIIVNNCENAMASDPATGVLYWGHPGALNMSRANYTVHQSRDGGLHWELLDRVYEHGAGYSDVHVLRAADGTPYLGALFQRTLYEPGAEGGGYNLAFAWVRLD